MAAVYLGIDIGTSSSKGVLVDQTGRVVARAQVDHAMALPRPGWAEMDADAIWWTDVVALSRRLTAGTPRPVASVAVSGIGPCLLPVDAGGRPLRPAILYGIDTRASVEIEQLSEHFGADQILRRGGSALSSQAVGPKIAWLRRNEPSVWAATRRIHMANSYAIWRLTGEYVLDHQSASQCDPLYDLERAEWATDWVAEVAPGLDLPRLSWSDEVAGYVTPNAAADTGIPAGTPVATGTIDAWAEALSIGVAEPGDAMLMYGTTMFIVAATDRVTPHPAMWATSGVTSGSRTFAAGMATSGALTSWFRSVAGDLPFERLNAEAAAVAPGSGGLVVLPYFAGERTPIFDPDARGVIAGLSLRHGRGHVYRALLEGTAYGVRHILEAMSVAGTKPVRIIAVGGGTRGDLWPRIVSDVIGRSQEIPTETIGAAYGDAMLAAMAMGDRDARRWNRIDRRVDPDPALSGLYDRLYRIYRELYLATRVHLHQLAAIQAESWVAVEDPGGTR